MGLLSRLGSAARAGARHMDDGMGRGALDTMLRHSGAGATLGAGGGLLIAQIVDAVITRSRSRMTEGGF